MSSFSVKFNPNRPCRYVFDANLWDSHANKFSKPIDVLFDTGAFNTTIHKMLVAKYGIMTNQTMKVTLGSYSGDANICILHKLRIGGHVLEKVVALAIPFDGELKDHILLGTNVMKNWKFAISSAENQLDVTEQFSDTARLREYPYRYCFDNKGQVMALQEIM
ncbi:MAG: retroviral-like aspartic protease family protein [Defluviitaleaceae bacterium]|nr:retroviral-like aspartic protease family protein [Defluviitaleaceae bacterium]